ncbi:hypothetical protein GGR52DRAFT_586310 [Hypoxylon sp. FL1284]|nr:hypothetical protein GGR52DRAFT_586310 [Hypoxylon sp. FL1284]
MAYEDINIPLHAFIAIDWVSMTFALIPVVLRLWVRWRPQHPRARTLALDVSDGLVLLAWASGAVFIGANTWKNRVRARFAHLPRSELYYGVPRGAASDRLLYVSWVSLFFVYASLWASKFSVLAFFHGGFVRRVGRRSVRVVFWFVCALAAATLALQVVFLTAWDLLVNDVGAVSGSTAANVATDVAILAVPVFAFFALGRERRGLTMPRAGSGRGRPRLGKAEIGGIVFLVCMAALSIVAALARWVTLLLLQDVPKEELSHTIDVWALVEIVASIVAVCLPSLRSFVRRRREGSSKRRLARWQSERREYITLGDSNESWRAARPSQPSIAQ